MVSPNFFDVLGVKAYRGRFFYPDEGKKIGADPLAVLSYSLWVRRFGSDPSVVGQTISLNATSYTVIGVAPPNFKGIVSLAPPDLLWVPLSMRDYAPPGPPQNTTTPPP